MKCANCSGKIREFPGGWAHVREGNGAVLGRECPPTYAEPTWEAE